MKRNSVFGVWQRCRVCGSIFAERPELQEHLATHGTRLNQPPQRQVEADLLEDEEEPQTVFSTVYQPSVRRMRQR